MRQSNAATMTLQKKGTHQRQKTMFIHRNREEAIQLPMDHNGAPYLNTCPTRHFASPNEVNEARVQTYYTKINKY